MATWLLRCLLNCRDIWEFQPQISHMHGFMSSLNLMSVYILNYFYQLNGTHFHQWINATSSYHCKSAPVNDMRAAYTEYFLIIFLYSMVEHFAQPQVIIANQHQSMTCGPPTLNISEVFFLYSMVEHFTHCSVLVLLCSSQSRPNYIREAHSSQWPHTHSNRKKRSCQVM